MAVAICWTLAWIGYAAWRGPWGAALAVAACTPFFASPDVWFLILPLLAALMELAGRPAPAALRLVLGAAIGLASLIKFTVLLAAIGVLAPLTAAAVLARRVPLLTIGALIGGGIAWAATGHGWSDWLAYLDWSGREISLGYSNAVQLPADRQLTEHAVAVTAGVWAAGALLAWRRLRRAAWAIVIALATTVFLLFKAGFVRADVHVFITCFGLLAIALLLALLWSHRPLRLAIAALLIALVPGRLWLHTLAVLGPPELYFPAIFPRQAVQRLLDGTTALRNGSLLNAYTKTGVDLRAANPLPALRGTIDTYPGDQALLFAYGADFRPRPVFQSFMAYTPRLAHANADALLGDAAPQWILFRVAPSDNQFPTLDDAPSWPILLTHYDFSERAGGFAILQRRATPRAWRLEAIDAVATHTGAEIAVPSAASGPIWVRIDVRETARDALVGTALHGPIVRIVVTLTDERAVTYRIVPALARDGFLLSPVILSTTEFVGLLQGNGPGAPQVARFRVSDFADEHRPVEVQFFRFIADPVL